MRYSKQTLLKVSGLVLALAAASEAIAASLTMKSAVLAQAPTPTSFPLPSAVPSGSRLKLDGSSSMTFINAALKQRFEEKFPGTKVYLAANGTSAALKALMDGEIGLAAVGRSLTSEEKTQGLVDVPISREKIAIIVSSENSFQGDLTFEQFVKIFRGEITDWSEVGREPGPIKFVDRPAASDTRQALSQYKIFQTAPFQTGPTAKQLDQDDTAAVVQELGKDGISYAIASQVLDQSNVRVISMNKTLPDDPRYPYSQPRGYAYKQGAVAPVTQAYLGFATSEPGKEAVAAAKQAEAAAVTAVGSSSSAESPNSAESAATTTPPATTSPAATASPEAATVAPTAASPAAASPAAAATPKGESGFAWWLLALPVFGGAAWLLLRRREADSIGSGAEIAAAVPPRPGLVPPPVAAAPVPDPRLILTPRDCRNAYAYWELSEARKAEMQQQGGRKLMLRLYDVTELIDQQTPDQQTPHRVTQFDCNEAEPDLHLPIAQDDRDYMAELGYVTADGRWLKVARSQAVRVPACAPAVDPAADNSAVDLAPNHPEDTRSVPAAAVIGGATLAAGTAAVAAKAPTPVVVPTVPSRIVLTPRNSEQAYAYWEAPEPNKAALRDQGGKLAQLRIYDVTDIDLDTQPAHSIQIYDISETEQDKSVPIAALDRDYLAEVGYLTDGGAWLKLARSTPIHMAASLVPPGIAAVGGIAAVAGAAVAGITSPAASPLEVAPAEPDAWVEPELPVGIEPSADDRCAIATVRVHSRLNCFLLAAEHMKQLEQIAVTHVLEPGSYLIRLKQGGFGYRTADGIADEPLVLLWIYGGKVVNQKTQVEAGATWSSLNGFAETLSLQVRETATLSAFFFDTYLEDNEGEVTVSVVKL